MIEAVTYQPELPPALAELLEPREIPDVRVPPIEKYLQPYFGGSNPLRAVVFYADRGVNLIVDKEPDQPSYFIMCINPATNPANSSYRAASRLFEKYGVVPVSYERIYTRGKIEFNGSPKFIFIPEDLDVLDYELSFSQRFQSALESIRELNEVQIQYAKDNIPQLEKVLARPKPLIKITELGTIFDISHHYD